MFIEIKTLYSQKTQRYHKVKIIENGTEGKRNIDFIIIYVKIKLTEYTCLQDSLWLKNHN